MPPKPANAEETPPWERGQSRSERVYEYLRDSIKEGRLPQGTRVREEDVARMLGVSRTPVREALFRLQTRGLLEIAPGRGLLVAEFARPRIMELYAMRELLEGGAARMAAQHASPLEIESLRYFITEFEAADPADGPRHAAINRRFHAAIYDAAHNRHLTAALNDMTDALALLRDTTFASPGRPSTALEEHRRVVAAIAARDPDAAEQAARDHIRAAQQVRLAMSLTMSESSTSWRVTPPRR